VRLQLALWGTLWMGCSAPRPESVVTQDVIVVAAQVQDFGPVQVGDPSSPGVITVDPDVGSQTDSIIAVSASCPDFTLDTPGLPADVHRTCMIVSCDGGDVMCEPGQGDFCQTIESQSYSFSATFRPTVAGPVSCVVTVQTADDANTRSITLTGTGVPPMIHAEVQPVTVAFGQVRRATESAPARITVRSTGGANLDVTSVAVSPGFTIQVGREGAYSLAPNATQDYDVVCQPPVVGPMTGQLIVMSSDPDQTTITVPLTCTGIDSNLDIQPSPATFATTRVGEPVTASIDLRNTGGATMTLDSITLIGDGITLVSTPAPGTVLDTAVAARAVLRFDAAARGETRATLIASYDGSRMRSIDISAQALGTSLALTPDGEVSFGPVCAGERKTQDFTLVGNDRGGFALETLSDPGAPFTISSPALPLAVEGAGANPVKFQITAAPTSAGAAAADVVVHTDIPGGVDHVLHLDVEGLPAGITGTPATIELGSRPINTTTIGKEVHLTNCSDATITYRNARIEGADPLDFAIVAEPPLPTIVPVAHASWLIVLQAHSAGLKQATFVVDHDGGTASFALQGEGIDTSAPPPPPPIVAAERGSYYACATGGPSALWPIAVALLALRRRRRER
jgi:MYXO-CTERM domain-containing protein